MADSSADPAPAVAEGWRRRLRALPVFAGGLPGLGAGTPGEGIPGAGIPGDPLVLTARWLDEAITAGVAAPHVAALATSSPERGPSVRMLIVKDLDASGIWFSTSDRSPKALDLAADPRAALTLYWRELGRQLRLSGPVDAPSAEISAADFRDRSRTARRELLAGDPSRPRVDAEERLAAADRLLDADPEAVAPDWTAYRLRPERAEFWAAQDAGPHRRLLYTRTGEGWRQEELWS
jgi:pyridoxamine 5'-phosphate oxidase